MENGTNPHLPFSAAGRAHTALTTLTLPVKLNHGSAAKDILGALQGFQSLKRISFNRKPAGWKSKKSIPVQRE